MRSRHHPGKESARDALAYAHWYWVTFDTDEGTYEVELYLDGRGILITPEGKAGLFDFTEYFADVRPLGTAHKPASPNDHQIFSAASSTVPSLSSCGSTVGSPAGLAG